MRAAVGFGASLRARSQPIPGCVVEHIDRFNSIAYARAEDRQRLGLVVPDIERGMDNTRRDKDRVACMKDLLFLVEPLFDAAADVKTTSSWSG